MWHIINITLQETRVIGWDSCFSFCKLSSASSRWSVAAQQCRPYAQVGNIMCWGSAGRSSFHHLWTPARPCRKRCLCGGPAAECEESYFTLTSHSYCCSYTFTSSQPWLCLPNFTQKLKGGKFSWTSLSNHILVFEAKLYLCLIRELRSEVWLVKPNETWYVTVRYAEVYIKRKQLNVTYIIKPLLQLINH